MAEITEYEYRLSQALDRLARWADQGAAVPPAGDATHAELEAERQVNAQLRARVEEVSARQNAVISRLEADLAAAREEAATLRAQSGAREARLVELAEGLESWLAAQGSGADEAQDQAGDQQGEADHG